MSSLRDQIAAKRAEAKKLGTPVRGSQQRSVLPDEESLVEERTISGQIRNAVKSGKVFVLLASF